jgi:hypothetical protein
MFPIEIYIAILVIDGLLTLYGVIFTGTEYWKNIVSLALATFFTVYIALISISGTVTYYDGSLIQDDGLMWIFFIIAAIQGIYTLIESAESYELYILKKEDKKNLIT